MLPFFTFSTTAPIRPPGNNFPPMTLSPKMVADEEDAADVDPASNGKFASLKFFCSIMCPRSLVPSRLGCHDTGCCGRVENLAFDRRNEYFTHF